MAACGKSVGHSGLGRLLGQQFAKTVILVVFLISGCSLTSEVFGDSSKDLGPGVSSVKPYAMGSIFDQYFKELSSDYHCLLSLRNKEFSSASSCTQDSRNHIPAGFLSNGSSGYASGVCYASLSFYGYLISGLRAGTKQALLYEKRAKSDCSHEGVDLVSVIELSGSNPMIIRQLLDLGLLRRTRPSRPSAPPARPVGPGKGV